MIIDVECEDGTTQIARTVLENQDSYIVNFLEKNKESFYHFIDEDEEVLKESVSGFYDVDTLEETDLFAKFPQGYVLLDDSEDEDFECSTSDEEEDTDDEISLVDEEEA
jgi:hypothetical protein